MPGMQGLGSALIMASGGRPLVRPVSELPDEALISLGPTQAIRDDLADVERRLVAAQDAVGPEAPSDGDDPSTLSSREAMTLPVRNRLGERRRRLQRMLEEAQERDQRSVRGGRPEGCWCLGLGGRGEHGIGIFSQTLDPQAQQWESSLEANLQVTICETYCPCPDGARLTAEHLEAIKEATEGRAQRRTQDELDRHWADLGLPEKSEIYPTLDDYPTTTIQQRTAIAEVKSWRPPRWLYLVGPTRRGKSTIAAALARHAEAKGWLVRFRSVPSLLQRLKAAMDHESETVDDVLRPLIEVKLLVLDDLGTETATRWAIEQLFILLDTRLNKGLTTIITSNLDLGAATDSLFFHLASGGPGPDFRVQAGRIVARIREAATVIKIDGPALTPEPAESLAW